MEQNAFWVMNVEVKEGKRRNQKDACVHIEFVNFRKLQTVAKNSKNVKNLKYTFNVHVFRNCLFLFT